MNIKSALATLVLLACMPACFGQSYVWFEDFESASPPAMPFSWSTSATGGGGGLGWQTHNGPLRWVRNDLPPHTKYMVVDERLVCCNHSAIAIGPLFSTVGLTNPMLAFDYSGSGLIGEEMVVEFSTNGGASYTPLDTLAGTSWRRWFLKLNAFPASANCRVRFRYSDGTYTPPPYNWGNDGMAFDNIGVYSAPAKDVGPIYITPIAGHVASYFDMGDTATFFLDLAGYGTDTIHDLTITRQVDSETPVTTTYTSTTLGTIPPLYTWSTGGYGAYARYVVTTPGVHTVKIWTSTTGDVTTNNDTITTTIVGLAPVNKPFKTPYYEENTGTWCGWCPRGIVFMDSLWKVDSARVSIAAIHSQILIDHNANDNPSSRAMDTFCKVRNPMGYPSAFADRTGLVATEDILNVQKTLRKRYAFADITISDTIIGSTLTATATVKPAENLSGDYRLELMVTEQDVPTAGQYNMYSHNTTYNMSGCGYDFNDSLLTIPMMNMHFVARASVPSNLGQQPNGIAGSLPSSMTVGTTYTYTFPSVTIPSNWVKEKLSCIALLIDNNQHSANYSYVLNSARNTHTPAHLVTLNTNNVAAIATDVALYPNPTGTDATLSFALNSAEEVSVTIYDALGRQMLLARPGRMTAGVHTLQLSTDGLPNGIYNVVLATGTHRTARMLSVMK